MTMEYCTSCAAAIDGCPEGVKLHNAEHDVIIARFRYAAGGPAPELRDAIDRWDEARARYSGVLSRRVYAALPPEQADALRSMPADLLAPETAGQAVESDGSATDPRLTP